MKFSWSLTNFVLFAALLLWPLNLFLSSRGGPSPFTETTIFVEDYQARQQILRNTYLYPNIFTARLFQNKLVIPTDKFKSNLFTLLDPNYYFFGSHPRELEKNNNLVRLPFVVLIFFIVGLINITSLTKYRLYGSLFLIFIIALSFFTNFDRLDFLLWPFFALFTYHGSEVLRRQNKVLFLCLFSALLAVTIWEYLRVFAVL